MRKISLLLLLLCLGCKDIPSGPPSAQVDWIIGRWVGKDTPGAAVLVVKSGKIVFEKGYGLANLKTREKISADTVFDLASVSKQFTAMAILILYDHGKLGLDDPLTKYFPEFAANGETITIRQLLNNVSGLPDYETLYNESGKISTNYPRSNSEPRDPYEPTTRDALGLLAEQSVLHFTPGEEFEYSDSCYVILSQIIERLSNETYSAFLKQNIFDPLGMNETVVFDQTKPEIKNRAISYARDGDLFKDIDYTPLNLIYGDGNINTSLRDMSLWMAGLDSSQLVRRETQELAFTSGKLADGELTGYGFGWGTGNSGATRIVAHTGSWVGFRNAFQYYPDLHSGVVILSNSAQFDPEAEHQLAIQIAHIYGLP
ncbi:MAG TPA: serine hydrolase domain-containing protein [Acidobacteriota bacterium]|nr:serine hydrolase domain-containing protein [Acidobacteriota bacterium]